jgi:hypothetical protein
MTRTNKNKKIKRVVGDPLFPERLEGREIVVMALKY